MNTLSSETRSLPDVSHFSPDNPVFSPEDLDLKKGDRVVVAMSGGVDSSVTAALMFEAGLDVIGITLQLYDQGEMAARKGACCAGQDIYDAKEVAERFGFPHYTLDYESIFSQEVIDDFADSYASGYTPIPCVRCNQRVKFKDLLLTAKKLGAKALATGHYVRREKDDAGKVRLLMGADHRRDQSYFLFATTQEQIEYLRFPIGAMDKDTTRAHALRFGLAVADKPDSQDICFVPNGNYADIVAKLRPGTLEAGDIVDEEGTVLGQHKGIIHYTVGQRRGLGIAAENPLFVVALDAENHRVIVGQRDQLLCQTIFIKDVNWLGDTPLSCTPQHVTVKVRSTRPGGLGTIALNTINDPALSGQAGTPPSSEAIVTLNDPEEGVSPGQACVFYKDTQVIGGGWITRTGR